MTLTELALDSGTNRSDESVEASSPSRAFLEGFMVVLFVVSDELVEAESSEDSTAFLFCISDCEKGCFGRWMADCEAVLLLVWGFSTPADFCVGVASLSKSCTGSTLCELAGSSTKDIGRREMCVCVDAWD